MVECRSCRNLRFPLPCSNHTRFGSVFVVAITVSVQPELYMPASYIPDTTSRIRFDSVLSKKAPIVLCKTGSLGQTHLVRKQAGVQKSTGPVWAERNWPAISFPLLDSVVFFQRRPESYCSKPARTRLVLADCQVLAKRVRPGSKPVRKIHQARFWPTLPSQFGSDSTFVLGAENPELSKIPSCKSSLGQNMVRARARARARVCVCVCVCVCV